MTCPRLIDRDNGSPIEQVMLALSPSQQGSNLIVELSLDPHVYLQDAALALLGLAHSATQAPSFRDRSTAVWRQVMLGGAQPSTFSLSWTAVANADPGSDYVATLSVRDARGILLDACEGSLNPAHFGRLIGPITNPTDCGQALLQLCECPGPATLAQ